MKIRLLCMGSVRNPDIARLVNEYTSKVPHYWPFDCASLPDVKLGKSASPDKQKDAECLRFMAEISPADFVVLFDERGRQMTSREFSDFIVRKSVELPSKLIFIIGGPYGFSQPMYERANMLMSLSKMTFPHELARLFAVEQIYRAGTISRGEPYHHD